MDVEITKLSGAALDWAVAYAWGMKVTVDDYGRLFGPKEWAPTVHFKRFTGIDGQIISQLMNTYKFSVYHDDTTRMWTVAKGSLTVTGQSFAEGVLRCFVAARFNPDKFIDVPNELLNDN